jgi:hypothetical protein
MTPVIHKTFMQRLTEAIIDPPIVEKIKQNLSIPNTIPDLSEYKRIIISETQPTNPIVGDLWIDTSE